MASLLLLCSLLFVPISADAAAISLPPNNLGLVGYWSFNEGSGNVATDFSGNGNHGTFNGDPQWVSGKLGSALEFDGDDTVDVGDIGIDLESNFTISAWMKSDKVTTSRMAIGIGHSTANSRLDFGLYNTGKFRVLLR